MSPNIIDKYIHVIIAHPNFQWQLLQDEKWKRFYLVGEIRTAQAVTIAFESDELLYFSELSDLLANTPDIWNVFGNCDPTRPRIQQSSL